jgi:hypothetical protein
MPRKDSENLSELAGDIVDQYSDLLLASIETVLAEHRDTMEDALSSTTRARRVPPDLERAIMESVRQDWLAAIEEISGDEDDEDDDDDDDEKEESESEDGDYEADEYEEEDEEEADDDKY